MKECCATTPKCSISSCSRPQEEGGVVGNQTKDCVTRQDIFIGSALSLSLCLSKKASISRNRSYGTFPNKTRATQKNSHTFLVEVNTELAIFSPSCQVF